MTLHTRQDAREKAGILKEENSYGFGTSRHVRFDANEKEDHEDYNTLIGWDDLLPWQRDNEFILTSHRRATFSYLRSLKSVLEVHNESVNIWSHVLGTAVFSCIAFVLHFSTSQRRVEEDSTSGDNGAIYVCFSSVIACFFFSFIHHIFLDHSEQVSTWTGRFDYPQSRHLRTTLYLLLGLSSFLPIIHGIYLYGVENMNHRMGLGYFLGLDLCHGTGAILYATRIFERWYSRLCDVVGSSHQIMYVLVVCGAATYGVGVLGAKRYWQTKGCEV